MDVGGPSRRDFMALLLGAPFAAAACKALPHTIDGTFFDTGMGQGHARLRDARLPPSPTAPYRGHQRIVIVGAGAAGLSAAWQLRHLGETDVTIYEHSPYVGGTATGHVGEGLSHPWGAHYIVAPLPHQTELLALLTEMGAVETRRADGSPIIDEALRCREPEERIFHRGRWYEGLYLYAGASSEDLAQLQAFTAEMHGFAQRLDATQRRAFAVPIAAGSNPLELRALDSISFADWLQGRGYTSPRLQWLADYACRDDFALRATHTSAWAGIFYFAARKAASGDQGQPVITWPEGNFALIRHLAQGQRVALNTTITCLTPNAGHVRVDGIDGAGPFYVTADRVIAAVPRYVYARLMPTLEPTQASTLSPAPDYAAWVVANVQLRSRPRTRPGNFAPAWDNVFYDSPSLGYVSATHQAGRETGATVLTWYYPLCDDDAAAARRQLATATHADWTHTIVADLARAHPDLRERISRIDIAFWGHGMIRPKPGHLWQPPRAAATAPREGIHVAHTDLSGVALFEEAQAQGCRAAREVAAALQPGRLALA